MKLVQRDVIPVTLKPQLPQLTAQRLRSFVWIVHPGKEWALAG